MAGIIVDLSSNNGHPIDYAAAKKAGVVAAFVKATEGTGYTNPHYAEDVAGFAAVGVPVLAYHFASFGDAAAEAAHFRSVAGARARVLDSETNTDEAWQNAFLAALNLPADEVVDYGSASTLPRSGVRALLWPASYGKAPGFGDCWQFTDAQVVAGIPGRVDASTWIGPAADFDALFSIAPPAPAPPAHITEGASMIPPTGTTDQPLFYACVRLLWATIRTDAGNMAGVRDLCWWAWNAQWAGNPDLLVAFIIDDATTKRVLRPAYAPSI
jgi:hypothetical protein